MPGPGFPLPLPLRNALARLALAAFADPAARAALAWLAAPGEAVLDPDAAARLAAVHLVDPGERRLLAVHEPWRQEAATHAHRALHAASLAARAGGGDEPVGRALARAAALWGEGLFFEVHEVLEPVWQTSAGPLRHALQGLIQVAVAWHHLGHGNRRGARSLLGDGRAKLVEAGEALPAVDVDGLLASTAPWEAALASGADLPPGGPPMLPLRRQA